MPSRPSRFGSALTGLLGVVGLSGLAGVLVAALVTPALAVTSMTANSTIGVFDSLPDYITINEQSQVNRLYAKKGEEWVQFAQIYKQNREEVEWDEVSQFVKDAVVAGEDRRFYEHGGVDVQSIMRAAVGNVTSGDIDSGASTLTMQLVKNIRMQEALQAPTDEERKELLAAAQAQSLDRKLKEAKLAIGLEKRYSKDEIMLAYLNIAGFGGNTYGIESAAKQYLSKSAADVTLAEAASLVAIVQMPNVRNLDNPEKYPANENRRNDILNIMLELGYITAEEHAEAVATPVEDYVKISAPINGCTNASLGQSFCDFVQKNVKNLEGLGDTPEERIANWNRGGYNIYTTLDVDQHQHAEAQVRTHAPANESRFQLGSVATAVEVGTGRILVMAQNKIFDERDLRDNPDPTRTAVNYATDREYGGSSGFPPGSTYKIVTLAEWLNAGHGLSEVVDSTHGKTFRHFAAACMGGWSGNYVGRNFGNENPGPVSVLRATMSSHNVGYLSMAEKLDLCDIRDMALKMGIHRADGGEMGTFPSDVLGTNEVSPLSMAVALSTIAGGGMMCEPIAVDSIVGPNGEELPGQTPSCSVAMSPEVAAAAARALMNVMTGGTGVASNPRNGIPVIGKTGTSDDAVHTWSISASSKVALAVWVGNIVGHQNLSRIGLATTWGTMARHAINRPVIDALTQKYGGSQFPEPPSNLVLGNVIALPDVAGQSLESVKSLLEGLGFTFRDGGPTPSALPAGVVASTDPAAGTRLSPGFVVTVYTSDGSLAVTMPEVVGLTLSDARDVITAEGFRNSNISVTWVENSDPSTWCTVSSSNPSGGTATTKSANVTLTVYSNEDGEEPPGPGC